jgi:type VI secretion system protein ImpK
VAGEVYFKNVSDLLTGDDSDRTADMLEVYQLCLLCGYRGKYGVGQERDVKMITDRIAEKMQRIRRTPAELAPFWHPGQDAAPQQADVWGTRMRYGAIGMVAAFVVLFPSLLVPLGNPRDWLADSSAWGKLQLARDSSPA